MFNAQSQPLPHSTLSEFPKIHRIELVVQKFELSDDVTAQSNEKQIVSKNQNGIENDIGKLQEPHDLKTQITRGPNVDDQFRIGTENLERERSDGGHGHDDEHLGNFPCYGEKSSKFGIQRSGIAVDFPEFFHVFYQIFQVILVVK